MLPTERAMTLNDEANDLFGEILHGRASLDDIAKFEQTVAALQAELTIDSQACDQWLDSHSAQDYLPESED